MPKSRSEILFVTQDKIWVNGEDPAYGYNSSNLEEILLEIKSKLSGKAVRLLLDDSLTYLVNIAVSKQPLTRLEILEKIQEQVPELIESGYWDYKLDIEGNVERIIAFVVKKDFLDTFSDNLINADLHIEASEPVCVALARLTEEEENPHLIVFTHHNQIVSSFVLAEKGNVVCVISTDGGVNALNISKFLQFCIQKYQLTPTKILLVGNQQVQESEIDGLPVGHVELNPFKGISEKRDITGPDEKVLNLDSEKLLKPIVLPENAEEDQEIRKKKRKRVLAVPVLLIILLGAAFFYYQSRSVPSASLSPSPITIATPEPTPAPDLNSYKIQIQNGTGVAGEAAKVQQLLEVASAAVGNAPSYDYEFTEVKLKSSVPVAIVGIIEEKLNGSYEVKQSAQSLTDSSEFDVVIITGKPN